MPGTRRTRPPAPTEGLHGGTAARTRPVVLRESHARPARPGSASRAIRKRPGRPRPAGRPAATVDPGDRPIPEGPGGPSDRRPPSRDWAPRGGHDRGRSRAEPRRRTAASTDPAAPASGPRPPGSGPADRPFRVVHPAILDPARPAGRGPDRPNARRAPSRRGGPFRPVARAMGARRREPAALAGRRRTLAGRSGSSARRPAAVPRPSSAFDRSAPPPDGRRSGPDDRRPTVQAAPTGPGPARSPIADLRSTGRSRRRTRSIRPATLVRASCIGTSRESGAGSAGAARTGPAVHTAAPSRPGRASAATVPRTSWATATRSWPGAVRSRRPSWPGARPGACSSCRSAARRSRSSSSTRRARASRSWRSRAAPSPP